MKKLMVIVMLLGLLVASGVPFSRASVTKSADDALLYVVTMKSAEEKEKYLIKEAESFLDKERYEDAAKIARYILKEIDETSAEAEDILHRSSEEGEKRMLQFNSISFPIGDKG